jgi:hypothetical protein
MSQIRRFGPLAVAVVFNLLGIWLFVRLAREGFPGEASRCFKDFVCYCEQTPIMAPLFVVGGALIVLSEQRARRREPARPQPWFGRALWLLGAGATCWGLSLMPGFPMCSDSFRYGHPLWHVLAASASGALWLHARRVLGSETSMREPTAKSAGPSKLVTRS